ncbi:MAG: DUF86 domain-containing protein [Bacteroidia bacterium]
MKEIEKDKERIGHILDSIKDIENITNNMTYDYFVGSYVTKLALVKLIEIIGEAANKVSENTKMKYKNVKWREIVATRHILVHDYNIINYDLLWEIIQQDLGSLKNEMEVMYYDLNNFTK